MITPFTNKNPPETSQMTTLLVVEDDDSIRQLLAEALGFGGYRVVAERTGSAGLASALTLVPDLLILDVNLPDMDGFALCERLRATGVTTPVIFLTARRSRDDVRIGFTGGGDDYITKPFSLEDLMLRIEAVLRRTRGRKLNEPNESDELNDPDEPDELHPPVEPRGGAGNASDIARLRHGTLVLDSEAIRVWNDGVEQPLTPTEFRLLDFLLRNRGIVLSKDRIVEHVWGWDFEGDVRIVESFVSALRRKLNDPMLVRTVRSYGYTIDTPSCP